MKIDAISIYRVDLPVRDAPYAWSTFSLDAFDSTVVEIRTDAGIAGYGEVCPLGPSYQPGYAEGARTGIATLAPTLIGRDPRQLGPLNALMDRALCGHAYVKSALDMACWDILGKATGLPCFALLGGKHQDRVRIYRVISRADPDAMAAKLAAYRDQGYTRFQIKVGEDPDRDIERIRRLAGAARPGDVLVADANAGWTQHQAIRVAAAVDDLDICLEQPCATYEACLAVRRRTANPFILDEVIDSLGVLLRACGDGAMDMINLKISRFGGLTGSRLIRDLCASLGIAMTIEDSWGGEIATAATAHLAHSTPGAVHFHSSAFHDYHTRAIAAGAPSVEAGYMIAPDAPGLGVTPDFGIIGEPLDVVSARGP